MFENWRWDSEHGLPESVTALRKMLALDPDLARHCRAWLFRSATPYFESTLILDQLPDLGADRVGSWQLSGRSHVLQPRRVARGFPSRRAAVYVRHLPAPRERERMTELRFYHLQDQPIERVLPQLLEISLARGWRVVVQAASEERVEALDAHLWTYRDDSFLPHGTARNAGRARTAGPDHRQRRQSQRRQCALPDRRRAGSGRRGAMNGWC